MSTFADSINYGNYYGSGKSSYASSGTSAVSKRQASSTNINRVVRDIASGYTSQLEHVQLYMNQGDVKQALTEYNNILQDIKETTDGYNYEFTDSQIKTILDQSYQAYTGESLASNAISSSKNSFLTGILEGIPLIGCLLTNGNSTAEITSEVCGNELKTSEKIKEYAGSIISGAAAGAAAGVVCPFFGSIVGGVAGAAIGLGQAVLKDKKFENNI